MRTPNNSPMKNTLKNTTIMELKASLDLSSLFMPTAAKTLAVEKKCHAF